MFPAMLVLGILLAIEGRLTWEHAAAVVMVVGIFVIPIVMGLAFGGGDLRFGAFSAMLVGLEGAGYFVTCAGLVHLALSVAAGQKVFPFAPAMSVGALLSYGVVYA